MRFNMHATEHHEVLSYISNRAVQLASEGYVWSTSMLGLLDENSDTWGYVTTFCRGNHTFYALYVLKQHRGKGLYKKYIREHGKDRTYITTPDCKVYGFLKAHAPHVVLACQFQSRPAYKAMQAVYGDRRAKRSQVHLMNHIDEGLVLLWNMGITDEATIDAYILHPLVQENKYFEKFLDYGSNLGIDAKTLMLTMEYRGVANAFLSQMENHRGYHNHEKIKLSNLKQVNDMLIADKIQNRKDFRRYNATHERADWLEKYFSQWLKALDVSEKQYTKVIEVL
jgi:hypothetical protein